MQPAAEGFPEAREEVGIEIDFARRILDPGLDLHFLQVHFMLCFQGLQHQFFLRADDMLGEQADERMDEEGLRVSRAFQKYLVEELGFAPKAKLLGMSWGGFFSTRYAANYPECVDRIYLDVPLMTFGGGFGGHNSKGAAAEIGPWAKMPPKDGDWLTDPRMPVNMADVIAKAKIPLFLLYGGQDQTVRPDLNCEPFVERFREAGGDITVKRRFAYGHHPLGEEPGQTHRIADFLDGSR